MSGGAPNPDRPVWSKAETHCVMCAKPLATQADYDTFPDGAGEHLCWVEWGSQCHYTGSDGALILSLRGEIERLQRACGEQAEMVRRWRNRASRYRGCWRRTERARDAAADRAASLAALLAETTDALALIHDENTYPDCSGGDCWSNVPELLGRARAALGEER